jgi:aspartyl-tRNA(Asn)/glutamyl-tRNA(Gln) amidotransferase subunit A
MSNPSEPWQFPVADLSTAFRPHKLTPSEVLESILTRHDAVNGVVNAIVKLDVEGARQAARASNERRCRGSAVSPLDGVPMTIKDSIHVAVMPPTWGSRMA